MQLGKEEALREGVAALCEDLAIGRVMKMYLKY
jgi:hypothetical protein